MKKERFEELLKDEAFKKRVLTAGEEELRQLLLSEGVMEAGEEIEILEEVPEDGAELSDEALDRVSGGQGLCRNICLGSKRVCKKVC